MSITETLKAKLDELEIERRVAAAAAEAEKLVHQAVEKAGEVAHERSAEIEGLLDKAGAAVDQRTEGKYADKVGKVKETLNGGVAKLAGRRSDPEA